MTRHSLLSGARPLRAGQRRGQGLAGGLCLVALLIVLAGRDRASAAPASGLTWLPGDYVDFAPAGLPDFSQCRAEWGQPGASGVPGEWTYAGPVALADALWWLDSAAEPAPAPPGTVHDGHALVTAYPEFGPAVDDHDAANLFPLVEDLALRAGTDGMGRQVQVRGTGWESFVEAVTLYLHGRRLTGQYGTLTATSPEPGWIAERVGEAAGTVLLLGIWEAQAEGWRRVGGHYAAVAGADAAGQTVALADPLADNAALGGAGRALPPGAAGHSCREAPRAHDVPTALVHDAYRMVGEPVLPHKGWTLDGYFGPGNYHEGAAFQGQNPIDALKPYRAAWSRGRIVMAVDAALAIVPRRSATPTQPATATATAEPPTEEPTATTAPSRTPPIGAVSTVTPVGVTVARLHLPQAWR